MGAPDLGHRRFAQAAANNGGGSETFACRTTSTHAGRTSPWAALGGIGSMIGLAFERARRSKTNKQLVSKMGGQS